MATTAAICTSPQAKPPSYTNAALAGAVDSGQGKPIYVSVRGTEAGGEAVASVIIYVRPPQFDLQVSPIETELQEQGTSLETEVVFTPKGAVGGISYQLATSPAVDWFEVKNNKLALVYATDVTQRSDRHQHDSSLRHSKRQRTLFAGP